MKIGHKAKVMIAASLLSCFVGASVFAATYKPITKVTYFGTKTSAISSAVAIPKDVASFWTSGTVPPVLNKDGQTVYERYGNTQAQGEGILKGLEAQLKEQGLSLKDVTYLRVYVAPDAELGGKPDYQGWFDAYAKYFNTKGNPTKPARSTVGVQSLVNADWLIEIEAFATYPMPKK
ncbi:RidA family protein [Cohnella lupini]|uniref:Enamine deaminase RidA (YjgF/YER057c/UK114 family) n=1 Tax=Cohnella lupini TaxID=1294267 RepID=A0A3D9I8L2_9BACL|nr:RidA family protein [Cohnella lupini]RED58067.1 enamine deaminase RidA (YjgF/YER057c/UK114 family) [Cohnella lupini]